MKINKHIEAIAAETDNIENVDLLQYIWNNRNTIDLFHISITNVARSGASRSMRVWINHKGHELDVTEVVASINGYTVRDGIMRVNGGGMDMTFAVLYNLYMKIASKRMKKDAMLFKAVNIKRLS